MRAVVLAGTERDRGRRRSPTRCSRGDTDAIVRVTHTAICGADLLPYHGYTPGFELGTILGHEFVGVVEDAGDALGALRARAARRQHEHDLRRQLRALPRGPADAVRRAARCSATPASTRGSTAARPSSCASRAPTAACGRFRTRSRARTRCSSPTSCRPAFSRCSAPGVGSGDVVVVLGCGPVGLMAVLCAVGVARRVIAVDGIAARRELAASLGAAAVDPADAAEAVAAATGGIGADGVIEASGSPAALAARARAGAPAGRDRGRRRALRARLPARTTARCSRRRSRSSFAIGNPGRDRERLFAMIADGVLRPSAVISDTRAAGGGAPRPTGRSTRARRRRWC